MTDRDDDIIDAGYLPRIVDLRLGDAPYTLIVHYDDGREMVTDMTGLVHKRRAFAAVRDLGEFAKVRVVFHGGGVEWDSGPDFSADALRHVAEVQEDMTGADFALWMGRMNLSNNEAADTLGVVVRTVKSYKAARDKPLPRTVTIACKAMERDHFLLHSNVRARLPGRRSEGRLRKTA